MMVSLLVFIQPLNLTIPVKIRLTYHNSRSMNPVACLYSRALSAALFSACLPGACCLLTTSTPNPKTS